MELTLDFESRSPIDIKRCGMYVYWQSPYTVPMMLSVKVDDEPTRVWIAPQFRYLVDTEITDEELAQLIEEADIIIAHHAAFERQGFKYGMTRLGFSDIPLEKVRCTQAQALMCALPRDLDSVARITSGGKWLKDKEGHNLMLKMSKPRMLVKAECVPLLPLLIEAGVLMEDSLWQDVRRIQGEFLETLALNRPLEPWQEFFFKEFLVYRENEQDFRRLVEYARQDTEVERYVYKQLPKIPEQELRVWFHDQRINDRGIGVDRESCEGLKRAVDIYVDQLSSHALSLTEGRVTSMKAPASITSWLREHGVETPSIDKEHVKELLDSELPPVVREFLEIRQKTGKSSVAKYEALLNYSTVDGRFRGFASYHAATPGRWGGNGPQLQNLPRPSEKNFVTAGDADTRREVTAFEEDIPLLVSCDFEFAQFFWKDLMVLAADLIRPMLVAKEGHDLVAADYSSVEARVLAWLAGQQDVLDGFVRGLDIYKVAASGIFKIPYEQIDGGGKGQQRQLGKTAILACGYGGGWNAMLRFGADKLGLSEEEGREIVKAWRTSNYKIVELWYALRDASLDAMRFPGERIHVSNISFRKRGSFLTTRLPSGRDLFYPNAKTEMCDLPWEDRDTGRPAQAKLVTGMTLTAAKQWVRRPLSHVTLSENVTQATARELLANGMQIVEDAGYPVIMHVHDEAVSEVPEGFGSVEEYENLLATLPEWATGMPLKAEGWRGKRYHK